MGIRYAHLSTFPPHAEPLERRTLLAAAIVDEGSPYTLSLSSFDRGSGVIVGWDIDWDDGPVQSVDSSSILIRYTKGADATLDGVVDGDDVTIVSADLNRSVTSDWFLGDFDYDGMVDGDDVTVLSAIYSPAAAPLTAPADDVDHASVISITDSTATSILTSNNPLLA